MLLKSTNPHLNKERTSFVVFNLQNIRHVNLLKGHACKNSQQRNLPDRHSLSSHLRKGRMNTTQQVDRSFSVALSHSLPEMSSLYLPLLIFRTPVVNKHLPESIRPQEHDQHAPVRGTVTRGHFWAKNMIFMHIGWGYTKLSYHVLVNLRYKCLNHCFRPYKFCNNLLTLMLFQTHMTILLSE